jgi:DNA-binding MarR family transcriptional regulator
MPFDDLPKIYEACQLLPDDYLTSSELNVLIAIAHKPLGNFEGLEWLQRATRLKKSALLRKIGILKKKGLITTEHRFAYRGRQQNYIYSPQGLERLIERVSLDTPINLKGLSNELKGAPESGKGVSKRLKGSPSIHPYKEYKQYKKDRDERFSFITKDLPENAIALIQYGNNIKEKLDNLERRGISLEAIKGALEETDFSNAYKVGGLFVEVLNRLIAEAEAITEKTIEQFTPRRCDLCAKDCAFRGQTRLTYEEFKEGYRCQFNSEAEFRIARERNGY